jgi:putative glutamine amidotransferase
VVSPSRPFIGIPVYKIRASKPSHIPLFALHPLYSEGVVAGGGIPLQIPHGLDQEALHAIFDRVDGLLLAGGGDIDPAFYHETASDKVYNVDRERDELEVTLVRWALEFGKPLLAICRGHQVVNVALGGSLYQDILFEMPGAMQHAYFEETGFTRDYLAHQVHLTPGSHLARLLDGLDLSVNSLHHQGIKKLSPALMAVGHAPDGLIEAVQIQGHPFFLGVQWHPEALIQNGSVMRRLFEALVEAAQRGHHRHL